MAKRGREEERLKLTHQINEWNADRYDLFALSLPNEDLEFFGVMRFFFQEDGSKVATKCIRVASSATTRDVLETLIEKFRPDMRMLSLPKYALYEVHVNGEERRLNFDEYPLDVQLNWGKDDREGRFLLKNEDDKTIPLQGTSVTNVAEEVGGPEGTGFKRKLSKREKKDKKKRDKEAKLRGKENESPAAAVEGGDDGGVANKLYTAMPDTSFTRSISNPEAVMRRRRALKLEKRLQEFRSKDGGPDKGGTLKIYGESIHPDVPYKTLLLSTTDTAVHVVKETLAKYGMNKVDPDDFCLVQRMTPPGAPDMGGGTGDRILEDEDCPLAILMHTHPSKGTVTFLLKRRPAGMPRRKKKRSSSASRLNDPERGGPDRGPDPYDPRGDTLPILSEIAPDGSEPYRARKFRLSPSVTEVGSEQATHGAHIRLQGPDVYPQHCVFTVTEGIVTVTPTNREAEILVNNKRIHETTMLQHGMTIRFGRLHFFRFCDPVVDQRQRPQTAEDMRQTRGAPYDPRDSSNFETTFDVDGHVETITAVPGAPKPLGDDLLPATLDYAEDGEDAFVAAVVSDVNGAQVQFKLAPTYSLYMAVRHRLARLSSPDVPPAERTRRLAGGLIAKLSEAVHATIQENRNEAGALSFWMANVSELLHFFKQDGEVGRHSREAQDMLAQAVQAAFNLLVDCLQRDLAVVMPAFLDPSMEDLQEADVLQVLSSAMSLLRRCRVNAALTIQLFSQLFHFINMWLFNKLVLEPRLGLCTAAWGHRLKRRLGRCEIWAEKHGLELAADCHLARIIQAAHLLEAPKSNPDDIANISSTCFKLNSLQMGALLEQYLPGPGEPRLSPDLLGRVVAVARSTADELTRSDGRQVRLEEEPDLQLPFLLPEDGYSCDIVKGLPSGLAEFLQPLALTGLCRMTVNPNSPGLWTVYFGPPGSPDAQNRAGPGPGPHPGPVPGLGPTKGGGLPGPASSPHLLPDPGQPGLPQEPEVMYVTFNKVNGSIGLSIVAAKGEGQRDRGIYVKSVVGGGGAAQDGRLQAGDQLLEVDGNNLIGLTQERAAELMVKTGYTVTLKVAKQGAIYHGLASMLSQPSPVMSRASPNRMGPAPMAGPGGPHGPGGPQGPKPQRPASEDVSRFGPPREGGGEYGPGEGPGARPLHLQHGARSSPHLPGARANEQIPERDPYGSYRQPPPASAGPHPQRAGDPRGGHPRGVGPRGVDPRGVDPRGVDPRAVEPRAVDPRDMALRSKSTSHLDKPAPEAVPQEANRHASSVSTLPRAGHYPGGPGGPPPAHKQQPPQQQRFASQPDLNRQGPPGRPGPQGSYPDVRRSDYENVPHQHQQQLLQQQQQPEPLGDGRRPREGGPPGGRREQDLRPAQSMPNVRDRGDGARGGEGGRGPGGPAPGAGAKDDGSGVRPKSEEIDHSRVREWQQRNERWGGPQGAPAAAAAAAAADPREVPRGPPPGAQPGGVPQAGFYQNTGPRGREAPPPFGQLKQPAEGPGAAHPKPSPAPKPTTPKPGVTPQEVPRMEVDNRRSQPYFFDPRQSSPQPPPQAGGPPGGPRASPRPHAPPSSQAQYAYGPPQGQPPPGYPGGDRGRSPELPPPPSPEGRAQSGPPPDDLPPPPPGQGYEPPSKEDEAMMRRWDSASRAAAAGGLTAQGQPPRGPPGARDNQQRKQQPQQQQQPRGPPGQSNYQNLPGPSSRPGPHHHQQQQQPSPQPHHHQQQQQPSPQPRNPHERSPEPDPALAALGYHYAPRPAPAALDVSRPVGSTPTERQPPTTTQKQQQQPKPLQQPQQQQQLPGNDPRASRTSLSKKPPPPVAVKPKGLLVAPPSEPPMRQSIWERDEKEQDEKRRQEELRARQDREVAELESRRYLSPDDQERLRLLRLEQEFSRRVDEADREEGRDDDSDTEMSTNPAGRARMLQLMQEDMERRQQLIRDPVAPHPDENTLADLEQLQRQERRLAQFEQERGEQRQRTAQRQEKKAAETEEYLRKQREMRERQREQFDEQRRLQKVDEERMREKQREELRRRKEMEREQTRELAAAREAEERAMREVTKRQEDERARREAATRRLTEERVAREAASRRQQQEAEAASRRQQQEAEAETARHKVLDRMQERDAQMRREFERMEKLGQPESGAGAPRYAAGGEGPQGDPPAAAGQQGRGSMPPPPPERRSSYDVYNRAGSTPNLAAAGAGPDQGPPRSGSASALRQPDLQQQQQQQQQLSKKSVSFNDNLEIRESRHFSSTSTYQSQSSQEAEGEGADYLYRRAAAVEPAPPLEPPGADPYQSPFQRPAYGPGGGLVAAQSHPQGPAAPTTPQQYPGDHGFQDHTPDHPPPGSLVTGATPGVIGAQEVYRDPRDRIAASRSQQQPQPLLGPAGDRLSFRDKMRMFAKEAGEQTPEDRTKISRAQQRIESQLNGR